MFIKMYDETEETQTHFVGFVGNHRWDLAITRTTHFYGKSLVTCIQSGRTGIIGHDDLEDDKIGTFAQTFGLEDEEQIEELRQYLRANL
jgi:hypothetical protein